MAQADLLWLQSFERGHLQSLEVLPKYNVKFGPRQVQFGLWDSVGMQATFRMYDLPVRFGTDVVMPATVITSLCCAPAARGRGYGGEGLKYMLAHMREAGQVITILAPFDMDYYRRLGWEWVQTTRTNRVPTRVIPVGPEANFVRAATASDRPGIQAAYKRFASGYRGMSVRDEAEWDLILDSTEECASYVYVFEMESEIEGYLVVRGGSIDETFLPEFITVTPRALRGLLGLLNRLRCQTSVFWWYAPENDGLWSKFNHREIITTLWAEYLGRVVDVPAALKLLKPDKALTGELTLAIEDPCAPWNQGTWAVSFANGEVSVSPTPKESQISMDIQAFSQAFFGALPLTKLRDQERLQVTTDPAFTALRSLLDGPPMWYNGPL